MNPTQAKITMQYLQFWDNFNWSLYVKILEIKMEKYKK